MILLEKKKICLTYTSHREEIVIASGIDIQGTLFDSYDLAYPYQLMFFPGKR